MITAGNMKGAQLRQMRREAGLRQDQLATLISVTPKTVHNWEAEKNKISASVEVGLWMLLQEKIADRESK